MVILQRTKKKSWPHIIANHDIGNEVQVEATASGGVKIILHDEDEFGNDMTHEVVFEKEDVMLLASRFNLKIVYE